MFPVKFHQQSRIDGIHWCTRYQLFLGVLSTYSIPGLYVHHSIAGRASSCDCCLMHFPSAKTRLHTDWTWPSYRPVQQVLSHEHVSIFMFFLKSLFCTSWQVYFPFTCLIEHVVWSRWALNMERHTPKHRMNRADLGAGIRSLRGAVLLTCTNEI